MGAWNWIKRAGSNIWEAFTSPPETVPSAYNSAIASTSSAIESTANALGTAKNWVTNSALPVASNFSASTLSVIVAPIVLASKLTGVGSDSSIIKFAEERAGNVGNAITSTASYTAENPKRAGALATQGIVNAGTSVAAIVPLIAGIAGDVIYAIPDYTLRPLANLGMSAVAGVGNLGLEKNNKFEAWNIGNSEMWSFTKKLNFSEGLNEWGQISNITDSKHFDRIDPSDSNPNTNIERTLLYGPQVVFEIGTFWAVSVATVGVGGAAIAATRLTSLGAKTVGQVKNADMLMQVKNADMLVLAIKAEGKLAKAEGKLQALQMNGGTANQITKAEKQVEKAEKAFGKLEEKAEKIGAMRAGDAVKKVVATETTLGVQQVSAQGTEKATVTSINTKLTEGQVANTATVEMSIAEQQTIAAQSKNVVQINAKSAQATTDSNAVIMNGVSARTTNGATVTITEAGAGGANATKATVTSVNSGVTTVSNSGAAAANTATYTTPNTLQRVTNGFNVSAYKMNRWVSPRHSPKLEITAAGAAFGLGVYTDIKTGEAHLAMDVATRKSITDSKQGAMSASLDPNAPMSSKFSDASAGGSNSISGAVSQYSGTNANQASTEFNNTVSGLRIGIDTPITLNISQKFAEELRASLKS